MREIQENFTTEEDSEKIYGCREPENQEETKMDMNSMLGSRTCGCGEIHSCAMKAVYIGPGALEKVRQAVKDYRRILLAADQNTYGACGEAVKEQLGESLENLLVYESEGYLVPNEEAVAAMEARLTEKTDLIVGVGSGVIQDLCKYVSHRAGLPYHIVATAPSMDGYASAGAAMIMESRKVTYQAHVPEVLIGDTEILRKAPMEMIQAGYGDILGKFSCLNDWKLSRVVNGEYFCQEVYGLTFDMLQRTKDLGPRLLKRDEEAVGILMEALVGVGIAMAYVGNSRPASGSEHHLSHFFEVTGLLNGEPYFAHGIDVAFSSVCTQRLREELLADTPPASGQTEEDGCFDWKSWEQDIRRVYTKAAEGVIGLQRRLGWYETDRRGVYREKWEEICRVLKEAPSVKELMGYLNSVGLDFQQFEQTYGEKKLADAIKYAKDLKDRYSVLWLYYDLKLRPHNGPAV